MIYLGIALAVVLFLGVRYEKHNHRADPQPLHEYYRSEYGYPETHDDRVDFIINYRIR